MVTKEVPEPGEDASEGTTSLRMKLFKGDMRNLLDEAASGAVSIFSSSASRAEDRKMPSLSDLTSDLVSSADVINRNRKKSDDFINLSDSDSS
jgi:hypothetical protein